MPALYQRAIDKLVESGLMEREEDGLCVHCLNETVVFRPIAEFNDAASHEGAFARCAACWSQIVEFHKGAEEG